MTTPTEQKSDALASPADAPVPKPIKPVISAINAPFWEGCKQGHLLAQRCTGCGELRHPASAVCPACLSTGFEWRELSGRGEIFSFVVIHRGYHPYWAARLPYNVAMVELEEGLMMFTNIIGIPNDQLKIGRRVKVAFERRDEDLTVPVFEPDGL